MLRVPVILIMLMLGHAGAQAFSWDGAKSERTLKLVREFQARHHVPSLAFSVTLDGEIIVSVDLGADGSVVPSDRLRVRYRIGSVSKQITAAAILALIEDNAPLPTIGAPLRLTTVLSDIYPDATPPGSDLGRITVKQLLTMTSNLPSYTDDDDLLSPDRTGVAPADRAGALLDIIARLKTYHPRGNEPEFHYSNTNYFILSLIVHTLNGGGRDAALLPVQTYMHARLLARAGTTQTGLLNEPAPPGTRDAPPTFLRPAKFNQGDWARGAGDLVSTGGDVARWNTALMAGTVLKRDSVELMLRPAALVRKSKLYRGCSYAMGWYVCEKPGYRLHQHDGVIPGFMASNAIARDPRGSTVSATILANRDATSDIVQLVRSIIDIAR